MDPSLTEEDLELLVGACAGVQRVCSGPWLSNDLLACLAQGRLPTAKCSYSSQACPCDHHVAPSHPTPWQDPHPDIHALFVHYNSLYFEDKLGACSGALRLLCLPLLFPPAGAPTRATST